MSAPPLPSRHRRLFAARLALLAVALGANLLLLANRLDLDLSLIIFASATSLYALLTALWWRCPTCGKYPGNSVMPDFCEECGSAFFGHDRTAATFEAGTSPAPKRRFLVLLVLRFMFGALLIAIFAVGGPRMNANVTFFWAVSIFFMVLGGWAEWKWWRCPHCGGYLKRTLWPGRTCTKCGGRLV